MSIKSKKAMASKRQRELQPRTYAFITFHEKGTYGYDEILAHHEQAESKVKWVNDWEDKKFAHLEEGEWMQLKADQLVFRVPMRTSLAKQEVKREVKKQAKKPSPDVSSEEDSSEESWDTMQARNYLRYA